jgi:hypothetical protein
MYAWLQVTTRAPEPPQQMLTLSFYPNYTNILQNFTGTLLGPVKTGVNKEADSAPVYLEDVLGALLNEAQHRASARGGPRQTGTPRQSRYACCGVLVVRRLLGLSDGNFTSRLHVEGQRN